MNIKKKSVGTVVLSSKNNHIVQDSRLLTAIL